MMGVQQGLPSVGHRVSQWLWAEATIRRRLAARERAAR